ncbi:metalloregulator ArsR/SmtB family transcription factor [Streptomyces sp. WMMC500]|uniref:ArsR/SmtB family transcription factor n=1 Tax=Streptomyces sp. WMMC500 TaxID=3015154 RepID=UPI00248C9AF2|nr:metalloregulator ArsR/SmtB family transcription factor [Streptomyces sp. WMMC500]WBB63044.1 metalloregulator ArsR/SmtB family transcription factor [Streptomyces sp. WMMC500]
MMRLSNQPEEASADDVSTSAVLRAFSDENRRTMLELVATREMSAGEIAEHFTVTRQAVSQHLRVLKEAGLVEERRAGRNRLYRTRADGLAILHRYFTNLWSNSLALAKEIAEESETDTHGEGDRGDESADPEGGLPG